MTDPAASTRSASECPDRQGSPCRDQIVLVDEGDELDDRRAPAVDFAVVNDEEAGIYKAVAGGREIAGLPYDIAKDDRLVLLATSVFPEFRKQGIATELIRRALDDVREQGKTVTVMCPIVHTFIERNPEYADLIDATRPGAVRGHR